MKTGHLPLVRAFEEALHEREFRNSLSTEEQARATADRLREMLAPASQGEITATLVLIASAWPSGHQRADPNAVDWFLKQLRDDLSPYPADILAEMVREARTTLMFTPSIAELIQIAERLMVRREQMVRIASAWPHEPEAGPLVSKWRRRRPSGGERIPHT